jgi:hypothetical protein
MKSIVYFILADRHEIIKIGYTTHLKRRFFALQATSPARLELLATMPGDAAVEKALHDKFSAERMHGEWFRRSLRLQKFIDDVNDGKVRDLVAIGTKVRVEYNGKRYSATPEQIFRGWELMFGAGWQTMLAERLNTTRQTIYHWQKAAEQGVCRLPEAALVATLEAHADKTKILQGHIEWLKASLDYDKEGNYCPRSETA